MPNNCAIQLNFVANNISVHSLYMIGDEISEKNKNKWSSYKSKVNGTMLEIETQKILIYIENESDGMFDIIDENGDVSHDWFKFMIKYIPTIFDKTAIYTLLVDDISFGTSKDWYNLFIHSSKKIDNKIRQSLIEKGKRSISITLSVNGIGFIPNECNNSSHTSIKTNKRRSIFSDRIPERRHSDVNLFGRNYKGKSMEKHYKKRISEPFIQYDSDDSSEVSDDESCDNFHNKSTENDLKLYDKKEFRTWLIKNHPEKNGDVQIFQMYRPISGKY